MFLLFISPSTGTQEFGTLNMAITEHDRRELFNGVEEAIGTKRANHLMELLPTSPSTHLVTRDDMNATTTMMRGEMAELRGEMAELRAEMRGEMAELRAEIKNDFASLKTSTERLILTGMIGNAVAVITALAV